MAAVYIRCGTLCFWELLRGIIKLVHIRAEVENVQMKNLFGCIEFIATCSNGSITCREFRDLHQVWNLILANISCYLVDRYKLRENVQKRKPFGFLKCTAQRAVDLC